MYVFQLNKLIREKIFVAMQADEFILEKQDLSNNDYFVELKNKLMEESHEVQQAKNDEELVDELADVLEVISSILQLKNIKMERVTSRQHAKKNERGGFSSKYKINSIKLSSDNELHAKWIKYFSTNPEKYPLTIE